MPGVHGSIHFSDARSLTASVISLGVFWLGRDFDGLAFWRAEASGVAVTTLDRGDTRKTKKNESSTRTKSETPCAVWSGLSESRVNRQRLAQKKKRRSQP